MTGKKGTTRRLRSDEEKRQLILGLEEIPQNQRGQWLKAQGITSSSWFYNMRVKYMHDHPEWFTNGAPQPEPLPVKLAGSMDFRAADEATQRLLLKQYNALPQAEKKSWREAHQMKPWDISGYRQRLSVPMTSTALARIPNRLARQQPIHIPVHPMPTRTVEIPTLADAVMAFEVKRDHMNEFIADLKRMLHTAR